jgi:hypothetical protein
LASVSASLLCDFAQVREGVLFVASGGLTRAYRPEMPAAIGMMLALVIEVPADEQDQAHEIVMVIKHNDTAQEAARLVGGFQVGRPPEAFPGETIYVPQVLDLRTVGVAQYGAYDVRLSVDSHEAPWLTFYVVKPPDTPKP